MEILYSHILAELQNSQNSNLKTSGLGIFDESPICSFVQNHIWIFVSACRWAEAEGGGRACSFVRAAFLGRLSARSTKLGEFSGSSSTGPGTGRH